MVPKLKHTLKCFAGERPRKQPGRCWSTPSRAHTPLRLLVAHGGETGGEIRTNACSWCGCKGSRSEAHCPAPLVTRRASHSCHSAAGSLGQRPTRHDAPAGRKTGSKALGHTESPQPPCMAGTLRQVRYWGLWRAGDATSHPLPGTGGPTAA